MTEFPSPVPEPRAGAVAPPISRDIYGMPAFATLAVSDLARTVAWYTGALDFIELFAIPGPNGSPVLVHLRRWRFQDILVRPSVDAVRPGSGMSLCFAAVYDELDDLAVRARRGGGVVDGPRDTPWNTRDLITTDPDGNSVMLTAGRPPELHDAAFSELMDLPTGARPDRQPALDPWH